VKKRVLPTAFSGFSASEIFWFEKIEPKISKKSPKIIILHVKAVYEWIGGIIILVALP